MRLFFLQRILFARQERKHPFGNIQHILVGMVNAYRQFRSVAANCLFSTRQSVLLRALDIHFEKALSAYPGAYAAINQAFASYLQNKYPALAYLDREDDMGIPGLRRAKLSYHPDHLVENYWARLWEDDDEH